MSLVNIGIEWIPTDGTDSFSHFLMEFSQVQLIYWIDFSYHIVFIS